MKQQTIDTLKEIKKRFRLVMNGPASQSMREKGVNYHLNWGVPLPVLRQMAKEYTPDTELAQELWKEDIRECKILATLLMPTDAMDKPLAQLWAEQTDVQEIAELAAFNLYSRLPFALELAKEWIATDNDLLRITGINIVSRLLAQGKELDNRDRDELLDQLHAAIDGSNLSLKHAAYNCLQRLSLK